MDYFQQECGPLAKTIKSFMTVYHFFELWRYLSYFGRAIALCIELWMCLQYVSTVVAKDTLQGNEEPDFAKQK